MKRIVDDDIQEVVLFVKNLNSDAENGSLVVVEGKRDKEALQSLGFRGSVTMLCHNGGIKRLIESAGLYRKTILLLDLDKEGRSLTGRAGRMLQGRITIDLSYRKELGAIAKGRIRHIEELSRFRDFILS
ncbi:MAG: topoisomerase [Thaumarchaeota archaeon]|nr:topoisomerase [Nitrososphaerota archaeon]